LWLNEKLFNVYCIFSSGNNPFESCKFADFKPAVEEKQEEKKQ
jgi:hypothetical protein